VCVCTTVVIHVHPAGSNNIHGRTSRDKYKNIRCIIYYYNIIIIIIIMCVHALEKLSSRECSREKVITINVRRKQRWNIRLRMVLSRRKLTR